ncbi:MAG: hypothetical protein CSB55_03865 [Candidatus Cloacimonadota bacterium]|nr:MAG: hypothetical protein CSB55_03865 [Candidatus Cloacimonadota bacterium]
MKKFILAAIIALLIVGGLFAENKKAPDFELENYKGKKVKLSDYKDSLVLLDFWATWCVPCKKEMVHLDKIQKKYGDKIKVLCVSIDKPRHKSKAISYVKSKRYKFMTLLDPDQKVKRLYNVDNPPRTVLIAPGGKIIWSHTGFTRGDEKHIEEEIEKYLKTKGE